MKAPLAAVPVSGTLAERLRITKRVAGRMFYETDTGDLWMDNGVSWVSQRMICNAPTANTAITSSTHTKVSLTTAVYDPYALLDDANDWIRVTKTGVYAVYKAVAWTLTGSWDVYTYVGVNGSTTDVRLEDGKRGIAATTGPLSSDASAGLVKLNANDTLHIGAWQTSGSSQQIGTRGYLGVELKALT